MGAVAGRVDVASRTWCCEPVRNRTREPGSPYPRIRYPVRRQIGTVCTIDSGRLVTPRAIRRDGRLHRWVTTGSTTAFLPWNAPVARLFLGDVGSYLLGALVGIGVVIGASQMSSVVVLLAPLSIYVASTGTALVRRALRGEQLTHRQQVYQRLVSETGMSHSTVAAVTVVLAVVITLAWVPGSPLLGVPLTLTVLATYLASPAALAHTVEPRRQRSGAGS